MWYRENFFKYATGIILVLIIIFLLGRLGFFFAPFQKFVAILFFPILVSGVFYYLFRPLLRFMEKIRIPRFWAILFIFFLTSVLLLFLINSTGSFISRQLNQLLVDLPKIIDSGRIKAEEIMRSKNIGGILTGKVGQQITTALERAMPVLIGHFWRTFTLIADFTAILILVPFILFYFLREDSRFSGNFLLKIPHKYRNEVAQMIGETDRILAAYIVGQVILALVIGALLYIGYLFLGVRYPLILALFAFFTSFIPMFGTIIGSIPAFLVGLSQTPWLIFKILLLIIIVHFFSSHLISPSLIGKRLAIHPLTVIIIFLVAASMFGFIGVLIAVPVYAVAKIILKSIVKIYRESKTST